MLCCPTKQSQTKKRQPTKIAALFRESNLMLEPSSDFNSIWKMTTESGVMDALRILSALVISHQCRSINAGPGSCLPFTKERVGFPLSCSRLVHTQDLLCLVIDQRRRYCACVLREWLSPLSLTPTHDTQLLARPTCLANFSSSLELSLSWMSSSWKALTRSSPLLLSLSCRVPSCMTMKAKKK